MSVTFALYRPTGSAIERLDPRAKITVALVLLGAAIIADSLPLKALVVAGLLIAWLAARLSVRVLAATVGSLAFFFLTTLTLRGVIRGAGAEDLSTLGPVTFSRSGVLDGAQMCLQILAVVLVLTLLVRGTAPVALSDGMEAMLRWSTRYGVPVHDGVMMFSIALRFLPVMSREFTRLQQAQIARGGGLHRGRVWTRARGILPILIPLVIVSLGRAKELSEAMDSRGYRGDVHRTPVRELHLGTRDWIVMLGSLLVLILSVATRIA